MNAKSEAQRVSLLQLNEKNVKYEYNPRVRNSEAVNNKSKNNSAKKKSGRKK